MEPLNRTPTISSFLFLTINIFIKQKSIFMRTRFLLFCITACIFLCFSQKAKANESEPNDTRNSADVLNLNGNQSGGIGTATDVDWFKVTTTGDGKLDVTIAVSNGINLWCYIYDNDGTTLLSSGYTAGTTTVSKDGLAAGTYYLKLFPYYAGQMPVYSISNTLTQPAQVNDVEPNDTRALAKVLPLNGSKTGHINYYYNNTKDTYDWYKVTTNADGRLRLTMTSANGQNVYAYLYDNDGTTELASSYTSGSAVVVNKDGLSAGTYYVRVNTYYSSEFAPYTLADSLFTPAQPNDTEPNDTKAQAITLAENSTTTGHINYYYNLLKDGADWYKLTTTRDGMISITITSNNGQNVWAYLYDNDGTTQLNAQYTTGTTTLNTDGLQAGTYYIRVNTYYTSEFAPYTLSNTLTAYSYAKDVEPNNSPYQAKTIPANGTSTGHVNFYYNNSRDTDDWWKVNYTGSGNLDFVINQEEHKSGGTSYLYFQVYKDTATSPLYSNYSNSASWNVSLSALTQGYYWIKLFTYYSNEYASYSFTNTFTQVNIANISITQAISGSCTGGQLQMQGSGSKPPYTVKLYRFGTLYDTYTTNSTGGYTASNLPPGTYYATAYGDGATGSAFGTSNTKNLLPPAPTTTSETNITSTTATVNYTQVACANGYVVQYRKQGTTQWTQEIVLGNKASLKLTGLTPGTTYEWRVATGVGTDAVSNYVLSAFTPIDVFTTTASFASADKTMQQSDVSISPNPASTHFTIQINTKIDEKVSAWLKDAEGHIFWTISNVNVSTLNTINVNVGNLKPGMYYLQIGNTNSMVTQKVIINR